MKVQTAFRPDQYLVDRIKKAKVHKRSLNNYVEYLLYKEVGNIPNETTKAAIEEARKGESERPLHCRATLWAGFPVTACTAGKAAGKSIPSCKVSVGSHEAEHT